jgi:periplasmic protein TonB
MTASAMLWMGEDDPRDLRRWAFAGIVVLTIHVGSIGGYAFSSAWFSPPPMTGEWDVPIDVTPGDADVDQPEVQPEPEVQQKQVEEEPKPVETPTDVATVTEEKIIEEENKPPPPAPTPALTKGGSPQVPKSWQSSVSKHLQHYKRYPSAAQLRSEEGEVLLSFSIDRSGHVLARHIERSSGHTDLDEEVLDLIKRADPLPALPANIPGTQLNLTVPIRFSMH